MSKIQKVCPQCGSIFLTRDKRTKHCSRQCGYNAHSLPDKRVDKDAAAYVGQRAWGLMGLSAIAEWGLP